MASYRPASWPASTAAASFSGAAAPLRSPYSNPPTNAASYAASYAASNANVNANVNAASKAASNANGAASASTTMAQRPSAAANASTNAASASASASTMVQRPSAAANGIGIGPRRPAMEAGDLRLAVDLARAGEGSGRGSLPPDVARMHRCVLPGPYLLQVNGMLDVARSAMAQLDELDGLAPPTAETSAMEEIFGPTATQATQATQHGSGPGRPPAARTAASSRMLKLSLTDGVQTVTAMEYRFIPALGATVNVGGKALDTILARGVRARRRQLSVANVEVRRGVLMLTPQNVTALGGSVPEFADRLDQRNQLRALLQLPPLATAGTDAGVRPTHEHPPGPTPRGVQRGAASLVDPDDDLAFLAMDDEDLLAGLPAAFVAGPTAPSVLPAPPARPAPATGPSAIRQRPASSPVGPGPTGPGTRPPPPFVPDPPGPGIRPSPPAKLPARPPAAAPAAATSASRQRSAPAPSLPTASAVPNVGAPVIDVDDLDDELLAPWNDLDDLDAIDGPWPDPSPPVDEPPAAAPKRPTAQPTPTGAKRGRSDPAKVVQRSLQSLTVPSDATATVQAKLVTFEGKVTYDNDRYSLQVVIEDAEGQQAHVVYAHAVRQLLESLLGVPVTTYRTLDRAHRNTLKTTRLADLIRPDLRPMTLDLRCANPAMLPEVVGPL